MTGMMENTKCCYFLWVNSLTIVTVEVYIFNFQFLHLAHCLDQLNIGDVIMHNTIQLFKGKRLSQ